MNERLIQMTKRLLLNCVLLSTAHAEWEALPSLPEPSGGFLWGTQGSKLIIAGGTNWTDGTKNWLKAVRAYDPTMKNWVKVTDLATSVGYGLVMQRSGVFGFVGGSDGKQALAVVNEFDGQKMDAKAVPVLPASLVLAAGGMVGDTMIISGGTDDAANVAGVRRMTCSLKREGDHWSVAHLADYPGKGFATAASAVVGGELFVFGGLNWNESSQAVENTTAAYALDPAKNTWRAIRSLTTPVRGVTAVTLDDHQIYIAGGYTDDFTTDAVIYDVKIDSYRKALPLPYAAMVALVKLDGFVYCLGGEDKMKSRTDKFFRIPVAELLK
ncbi:kelch repeat-containing protein [Prosthecobacter sp.]|uniref:Kelch repeat-containing protein n=1 Tax=Prosthecobacter sp. TaxID=1965333 RepID=UPI001DA1D481|nr:kelch repeat-containing protein [Prosthecobacter sp.]MCB1276600.1 hypothetical protein [Prosthecobacter sp.]